MKITENELLEALRKFGKAAPKRPAGDGWQTLEELAAAEQTTVPAIRYRLKHALERGVPIEVANGTAVQEDGRLKRAAYYRIKPKGAK